MHDIQKLTRLKKMRAELEPGTALKTADAAWLDKAEADEAAALVEIQAHNAQFDRFQVVRAENTLMNAEDTAWLNAEELARKEGVRSKYKPIKAWKAEVEALGQKLPEAEEAWIADYLAKNGLVIVGRLL